MLRLTNERSTNKGTPNVDFTMESKSINYPFIL
jgi:hypothetical protein